MAHPRGGRGSVEAAPRRAPRGSGLFLFLWERRPRRDFPGWRPLQYGKDSRRGRRSHKNEKTQARPRGLTGRLRGILEWRTPAAGAGRWRPHRAGHRGERPLFFACGSGVPAAISPAGRRSNTEKIRGGDAAPTKNGKPQAGSRVLWRVRSGIGVPSGPHATPAGTAPRAMALPLTREQRGSPQKKPRGFRPRGFSGESGRW